MRYLGDIGDCIGVVGSYGCWWVPMGAGGDMEFLWGMGESYRVYRISMGYMGSYGVYAIPMRYMGFYGGYGDLWVLLCSYGFRGGRGESSPCSLNGFGAMDIGQLPQTEAVASRRIHVTVHGDHGTTGRDLKGLPDLNVHLEIGDGTPIFRGWKKKNTSLCTFQDL